MHLAIQPEERTVGVNNSCGIVVKSGGAFFEERGHYDYFVLPGELLKSDGSRPGNEVGEAEILVVFGLAKVLRAKELLRANDLRASFGGIFCGREGLSQLRLGIAPPA